MDTVGIYIRATICGFMAEVDSSNARHSETKSGGFTHIFTEMG